MFIGHTLPSEEKIKLLNSGKLLFDELERLIDEATEEIHFQIYIFENDETGLRIGNALLRAATRGVKIYLFIDAFGSNISPELLEKIKLKGGNIRYFGPIFYGGHFHIGRRLHRKLIIFDRKIAVTGGFNISNNYNDIKGSRAWLDFAIISEGVVVTRLYSICLRRWIKKSLRKRFIQRLRYRMSKAQKKIGAHIHVRENDWLKGINEANASYRREIKNAKESLFRIYASFPPTVRVAIIGNIWDVMPGISINYISFNVAHEGQI